MTMAFGPTASTLGRQSVLSNQSANRSATLGRSYQGFANPFFDLAGTYTPPTIKGLFAFCRHFMLTHGIINAIITKASEYPITDLILSHKDRAVKDRWEELLNGVLNYRVHQYEVNLEFQTYGNAFISPSLPFTKMLRCVRCNADSSALTTRANWRYSARGFWLSCPKCGQTDWAKVRDDYFPRLADIGLVRWNPELVNTFYNEATGRTDYTLDFSAEFKNGIEIGRKDLVATTPQSILEAVKMKRTLVFDQNSVFHMRRPGLSGMARWGIPMMMPVLKDAFFLQVMKKAQECVAPDTLIDTERGLVRADDVAVGDRVRTHRGRYMPVSARADRPLRTAERVFEIRTSGMRQLPAVFSETHPCMVLRRNEEWRRIDTKEQQRSSVVLKKPHLYEWMWVKADDVVAGDYVAFPTDRQREPCTLDLAKYGAWSVVTGGHAYLEASAATAQEFEADGNGSHGGSARKVARRLLRDGKEPMRLPRHVELDEDLAYLAGWYVGDGCASDRAVTYCMGPEDDGIELQEAIGRVFPFTTFGSYPATNSRGWSLKVHGSAFARFLSAWIPGKAQTKRVPEEVRNAPDSVVLAFLRGYLEADGYRRENYVHAVTASRQLAYDVWALGVSLGCIGTISTRAAYDCVISKLDGSEQALPANGRQHHFVVWSHRSAARLNALMADEPAEEVISGKSGFFFKGYFASRVLSVEETEAEKVIDFEIAEDNTFCVPGMVVHNSILLTHLVPQIFLFPQPATSGADPFTSTSLTDWRDHIRRELARQRMDPAYMAILPFPLGHQSIGENGRSLLLNAEMQQAAEQICIGMGFPVDLVFGNGTYAGSSVNMRMLENLFLANTHGHVRLVHWVLKHFHSFLNWPMPDARFKAFRMADDLQRSALMVQLCQQDLISETTLLSQIDLKVEDETQLRTNEMMIKAEAARKKAELMAEVQGQAGVIGAKYQAQAQGAMQAAAQRDMVGRKSPFEVEFQSGVTKPPGITLDAAAAALAEALKRMPRERREAYLGQLRGSLPEMQHMLDQQQGMGLPAVPGEDPTATMQGGGAPAQGGGQGGPPQMLDPSQAVDTRALPEKLPPRRAGGV